MYSIYLIISHFTLAVYYSPKSIRHGSYLIVDEFLGDIGPPFIDQPLVV